MPGASERNPATAPPLRAALQSQLQTLRISRKGASPPGPRKVHAIRVALKRFRAILRLARAGLDETEYFRIDRAASRLKGAFASCRDMDVMTRLVRDLFSKPDAAMLLERLSKPAGGIRSSARQAAQAESLARRLKETLRKANFAKLKNAMIKRALKRSVREARSWFVRCVSPPRDDEMFHEWRKRVKILIYQLEHLDGGRAGRREVKRLKQLAAELGRHHDLALLEARLARLRRPAIPQQFLEAVRKEKQSAAASALRRGRKVFQEENASILPKKP